MSPMELIKKAFGIFKKKSAVPPKAADAPFEHDDNVVLVFGHSNAGKTVYFSVLYELLKGNWRISNYRRWITKRLPT